MRKREIQHVLIVALMLFGVGLINGRPAIFADTPGYYAQGDYVARRLHLLSDDPAARRPNDPTSVTPEPGNEDATKALDAVAARSPFYGLFLVVAHRIGTLWLLAWLQAWAASWVVWRMVRANRTTDAVPVFYVMGFVLAAGTSLPFYAAFAMPDLFGGLALPCAVLILLPERGRSRWSGVGPLALLATALAFQPASSATVLVLLLPGLALLALMRERPVSILARGGLVLGAVAAAATATAAFHTAYRRDTGLSQGSPPFLMARVVADGPGRDYLAAACPGGASPTLCRFTDRPLLYSDVILWDHDPGTGVFSASDAATRKQLKADEFRFVLAAVTADPWAQLKASAGNWWRQLLLFDVWEPFHNPAGFLGNPFWTKTSIPPLIPDAAACLRDTTACEPRLSGHGLDLARRAVLVVSLLVLAWSMVGLANTRTDDPDRMRRVATASLLVLGIIANAAVCGILSGPFPRYQARVVWLLPMAAILVWPRGGGRDESASPRGRRASAVL